MKSRTDIKKLALTGILTALVLAFQYLGSFIHIGPTSVSLVLIPIAVGAIILGAKAGAFLGFVFGAMTLWAGVSGTDYFTSVLFSAQPFATAVICIGKATLAGLFAGLVYKAVSGKSKLAAAILASVTAPVVNTGLFILGGLFLVNETLSANFVDGTTLIYFLVIGCAGLNFIAEFFVNLIVSPAINTIVNAVSKKRY